MSSWTFTCYECIWHPPPPISCFIESNFFPSHFSIHTECPQWFSSELYPSSVHKRTPHYSAEWLATAYIMISSISMKWNVSHSQKLVSHCLWEGLNLECGRQNVECLQCSGHTWNTDWEVELNNRMTGTLHVWIKWKAPSRVQNSTQECTLSMSHNAAVTLVWYMSVCVFPQRTAPVIHTTKESLVYSSWVTVSVELMVSISPYLCTADVCD